MPLWGKGWEERLENMCVALQSICHQDMWLCLHPRPLGVENWLREAMTVLQMTQFRCLWRLLRLIWKPWMTFCQYTLVLCSGQYPFSFVVACALLIIYYFECIPSWKWYTLCLCHHLDLARSEFLLSVLMLESPIIKTVDVMGLYVYCRRYLLWKNKIRFLLTWLWILRNLYLL